MFRVFFGSAAILRDFVTSRWKLTWLICAVAFEMMAGEFRSSTFSWFTSLLQVRKQSQDWRWISNVEREKLHWLWCTCLLPHARSCSVSIRDNISGDHCGFGDIVIKHFNHYRELASDSGTFPGIWQHLRPGGASFLTVSFKKSCIQEEKKPRLPLYVIKFGMGTSQCSEVAVKHTVKQSSDHTWWGNVAARRKRQRVAHKKPSVGWLIQVFFGYI